jgi:membrane protease YdiL (CAAX protease family)
MLDPEPSNTEALLPGSQLERPVTGRRLRWFELFLVLLVAVGSPLLNALYLLKNGPGAMPHTTNASWSILILREVSALLLLGYVLSRRNLRFKDLGLRWSLRGVGVGILLTVASYMSYALGTVIVQALHLAMFGTGVRGPTGRDFFAHPSIAVIPYFLLNPFFEELIVRAYLMTEVMDLTGSRVLAVFLSVVVQSSYHLYYGWGVAIAISFQFLVFAIYYARSRQALPVIVAHGFFDIFALFRLW